MGYGKNRKYTHKEFKDNFVDLASNSTKKGHLTSQSRNAGDIQFIDGILKQIVKSRIDSDGWIVEVGDKSDKQSYKCTNPNPLIIPDSTETETMYIPKKKVKVKISIDKKSHVYNIVNIDDGDNQVSLAKYRNTLYVSVDNNTKNNTSSNAVITMTNNSINLDAKSITISNGDDEINLMETQQNQSQQIQNLQDENALLREKITNIETQLKEEKEEDDE